MPRVSRKEADQHRADVIKAAARRTRCSSSAIRGPAIGVHARRGVRLRRCAGCRASRAQGADPGGFWRRTQLARRAARAAHRGKRKKVPREEVLATPSLLVGALVLARATEGQTISDEFLSSARKVLLER